MDDNGNIDDNIDGTNEYDITEPPHEQLYTDSDRENDVNKYGIELGYWNGGEESERSVGINEGESSASGSDVEKPEILNTIKNVKGKKFEYDDYGKIHLECSLFFVDVNEFRNVLRDYVIQENFDIIRVKNEKARVTAICASDGCPWRIHASPGLDGRAFMIKSYEPSHTCIRQSEKNNITSTWIAEKLKGSLSADPNMSYELMSNELNTKFGVEAHRMQLYRARKKGKEQVEGSHVESYKKMLKYAELLLERNRGSIVKLNYHDRTSLEETPVFKRIFVCLAACRDGFLNGCRPFFGLDGCHLKGPYGGVLICAVSLDANNGLFPIAFAVVEVESKDSWSYFLEHLLEAIGDDRYIIMSDRQKGLTQAVSEIFPNSWHRHCMDGLRVKIMMRIYAKSITSWPQIVGPRIVKAINETIEDARFCRVKLAGRNLYEVYDGFTRFPVDLVSHTCECKAWQISGLPCKHGAAAIIYTRAKVENFCDAYYSIEKYITTYSGLVSPLPGLNTLEEIDLLPPPLRRLPGRPKKSRRREKDEAPPSDRASTSASQTSTRREIQEYASVQAKAKSQLKAKRTKRDVLSISTTNLESHSTINSFTPTSRATFTPFSTAKASVTATSLRAGVELMKAPMTHPLQSLRTPPIAPSPLIFTAASTLSFPKGNCGFSQLKQDLTEKTPLASPFQAHLSVVHNLAKGIHRIFLQVSSSKANSIFSSSHDVPSADINSLTQVKFIASVLVARCIPARVPGTHGSRHINVDLPSPTILYNPSESKSLPTRRLRQVCDGR
ncbi:uncharacterized protein G2W53_004815 [Senna tora]|uniref:SWIM-type domain-containing protein n=1 Tax=Senna tora TaxID=362788 RepID=A0A834XCU6_9FABA|nr:uncharacterized protein G2W53_004815 [Senna tora]